MRNTEQAFHWIINLLEEKNIPYKISGGLAVQAYGSNRDLIDIDIEVEDGSIQKIIEHVEPYVTFGPAPCDDGVWDVLLLAITYEGQVIEIVETDAKIFNKRLQVWESWSGNVQDACMKELYGRVVPVESKRSLVATKEKLGREVDEIDLIFLKNLKG